MKVYINDNDSHYHRRHCHLTNFSYSPVTPDYATLRTYKEQADGLHYGWSTIIINGRIYSPCSHCLHDEIGTL